MKQFPKPLLIAVVFIFAVYFLFGSFALNLPTVNPDELWVTSRAYHLERTHHLGDPILPVSVSPFYSSVQYMGWKSWLFGSLKTGSQAVCIKIFPFNPHLAVRFCTFLWSVLACLLTFFLAARMLKDKWVALLSVAWLISIPEFFSQIHRERPEIMICAAYIGGLILFLKAKEEENISRRKLLFLMAGIYSWIPALMIHPSALMIPVVFGILYLLSEWKKMFSIQTFLFGIGMVGGMLLFLWAINSLAAVSIEHGGDNYFKYQSPPIVKHGWWQFVRLPFLFYQKFYWSGFLSQPVSFLFFITAISILFISRKKNIHEFFTGRFYFLCVTILGPLLTLMLLSGSYGSYNIIVAPLIAIILASVSQAIIVRSRSILKLSILALGICFLSNASGMQDHLKNSREFRRINHQVKAVIPDGNKVMGIALYYLPFRDEGFYSISWFNVYAGRREQSFEDAVRVLGVRYLVVDDAFVARAFLERGYPWTDSMHTFIKDHGSQVLEMETDYDVGKRVPKAAQYPEWWKYPALRQGKIKKVSVYQLTY